MSDRCLAMSKSGVSEYLKHLVNAVITGNLTEEQPCNIHKMLKNATQNKWKI